MIFIEACRNYSSTLQTAMEIINAHADWLYLQPMENAGFSEYIMNS